MRTIRLFFSLLFGITFLVSFLVMGLQNPQPIELRFLHWKTATLPFSYFIFAGFIVGFVVAGFITMIEIVRLQLRLRRARRLQELLEREVDALRNQPLYDEPPVTTSQVTEAEKNRFPHDGFPEHTLLDLERE